jgi:type III restriction enzyme
MPDVVIENPILNSPFTEPTRHFHFDDDGITNTIVQGRRISSYFVPIAQSKKKGKKGGQQLAFDTEWTRDRIEPNDLVNDIRVRVNLWRQGGYQGVTATTADLLRYWTDPERERKLFFCQIEALETVIYLTEAANKFGDEWMANRLVEANDSSNPGLPRVALKMATGAGKTVVMAMLIAWQALNKLASPQDKRFTDSFLIVTPGITIRDRLRVLLPSDPQNYYRERDLLPAWQMDRLNQARIVITNYHAFQNREKVKASKLTKSLLGGEDTEVFKETDDEMVNRVCRAFGSRKKEIIVLNDEAHHCYRRRPPTESEKVAAKLVGEDRKEAERNNEEARIWISGVEAVKRKLGIKTIYDLSATPFFLRGSGYSEGTLFPWVVSDFSLIDAIESGIVKVPRVPVEDDAVAAEGPTYRQIWPLIRDELPKKGRKTDSVEGQEPTLPVELQGALHSLYGNYVKSFQRWEAQEKERPGGSTPPVFIVVCNNTNVSKLVFDYIAGWEKQIGEEMYVQAGKLDLFANDDGNGHWLPRPNTILVDSQQLESGEAMSDDFKQIAAREIEEFKHEFRERFPGRDIDDRSDEDLLREVMNTVGKKGRLGEHVRCVVSVSMLTEGWDANTVTHILGVRAFGTQLLCEQVVGRALRRMSYAADEDGMFAPEYAEVYGVPFSFIPTTGSTGDPVPRSIPTRVRALESRVDAQITFPRLLGYRHDVKDGRLEATFTEKSTLALSPEDIPTRTDMAPIIGEASRHDLWDLKRHRLNTVAFEIAKLTLDRYFRDQEDNNRPWLFPQLLEITKRWMREYVVLKDHAFPQMLLIDGYRHDAADRIRNAVVATSGETTLWPIMRPYDTVGSTRYVDFDTTKPTWITDADKCHVTHVVADTGSWEQKVAQTLEELDAVVRYVKNEGLGFTIPYAIEGAQKNYVPDFIAVVDDNHPFGEPLNLIIEVSGEARKDKAAKTATARGLWVPAVNNHGGFGRWSFLEVVDPWTAESLITAHIASLAPEAVAAD